MPTKLILIGPPMAMVQNEIYAMPARSTKGWITAAATLQGGGLQDGTGMAAVTVTASEFQTASPFVRATSAGASIRLQAL